MGGGGAWPALRLLLLLLLLLGVLWYLQVRSLLMRSLLVGWQLWRLGLPRMVQGTRLFGCGGKGPGDACAAVAAPALQQTPSCTPPHHACACMDRNAAQP